MITISSGDYDLDVAPDHGGAILSFRCKGADILRSGDEAAVARDPRNAACYPCAPYFGRIEGGISFAGRRWAVGPTLPICDASSALHGEGWISPWEILERTDQRLECRFAHGAEEAGRYPFPYEARQVFELSEGGLSVTLSLKNSGNEPMPGGLALHPFFPRRADIAVRFAARRFWTPPQGSARGRLSPLPDALGAGRFAALPAETRDHAYAGFDGEAGIRSAGRDILVKSDALIVHLFAPARASYFCLEPVTHLPGALTDRVTGYGGEVLAPGASLSLSMSLGIP